MSLTQEYQDCDSIIKRRSSAEVEVLNLYTSLVSMVDLMEAVNADVPRRAKFDTMYRKIDSGYDKAEFDEYIEDLRALKVRIEEDGFVPED